MSEQRRDTIPLDAVGPYHLRFDITNEDIDPQDAELTDVIDAAFEVTKPDGTVVTWAAQIESISATLLRVAYEFIADDLDQLGEYRVRPVLTVAVGGPLFAFLRWFTVTPR